MIGGLIIMLSCCGMPGGVNPNDKTVMINPPGAYHNRGVNENLTPATNFERTWLNCLKQQNPQNFPRLLSYQITAAQGCPPFSPKWQCSSGRFRISRVLCVFFPFIFMCLISAEWPSLFNIDVDTKSGILCNFNPCNYYAHLYSCRIEMIFSGGSRIFLRGHQLPKWVC